MIPFSQLLFSNGYSKSAVYCLAEVGFYLTAQSLYYYSPAQTIPFHPSLLIFVAELVKLLLSLLNIKEFRSKSTNWHLFAIQSGLYVACQLLFFEAVKVSLVSSISLLAHLQLPITALIYYIRGDGNIILLLCGFLVSVGVLITQLNWGFAFLHVTAIIICTVAAAFYSFASALNDAFVQPLNMPVWEQQYHFSLLAVIYSIFNMLFSADRLIAFDSMNFESNILSAVFVGVSILWHLISTNPNIINRPGWIMSKAFSSFALVIILNYWFDMYGFVQNHLIIGYLVLLFGVFVKVLNLKKLKPAKQYEALHELGKESDDSANGVKTSIRLILFIIPFCILGTVNIWRNGHLSNKSVEAEAFMKSNDIDWLEANGCFVDPLKVENETANLTSMDAVHKIRQECALYTPEMAKKCVIPNVIHLIMFGNHFKFHHYIAILSFGRKIKPARFYIHGYDFPTSQLFLDLVKEMNIILVKSRNADYIFDIKIKLMEHKSDAIRLESILRFGGMYFDLDVYAISHLNDWHAHESLSSFQDDEYGINTGILISQRCGRFLQTWYEEYKSFNPDGWDDHSIKLPRKLYDEGVNSQYLTIAPSTVIFQSYFHQFFTWKKEIWRKSDFRDLRLVHAFYRDYGKKYEVETFKDVSKNETIPFVLLARHLLYNEPLFPLDVE